MPIYEYCCDECGERFELFVRSADPQSAATCPRWQRTAGAQGHLAIWRRWQGGVQQGERGPLLLPRSHLSDEALGGREPPIGGSET